MLVVREAWTAGGLASSLADIKGKLSVCAVHLKGWSLVKFGSLKRAILSLQKEVEVLLLQAHIRGSMALVQAKEKQLEGLLEREEIYWKQRSRADWLLAGDQNSKFFHAQASARKKKNTIVSLTDDNGSIHTSPEGISITVHQYFSSLFNSTNPSVEDIERATRGIESRLTVQMNDWLDDMFSFTDVKRAVFELRSFKAPDPDGFHAIFFQKF
ncbi:hypothetical protein Dsin_018188 [Dipteronia sinensis]|uniref:Uncharacterized protein n=1 Tax=Dipteronia sinensis TaxID=43782 RepID=A0AAE0A5F0_9ROSI|nr:hypothetical protein Dsin_018188 [Dipteronia sinensis]